MPSQPPHHGIRELSPAEIFSFICNDFETAWNAVARQRSGARIARHLGRANFLFALQAMVLLEWACRVCAVDPDCVSRADHTPAALAVFGSALHAIRSEYFIAVPTKIGQVIDSKTKRPVRLPPFPKGEPKPQGRSSPLLWLLWDVIRNGQLHQYQSVVARQTDGQQLYVALSGAEQRRTLKATAEQRLDLDHLAPDVRFSGALGIPVHPQCLYLDLRDAVIRANLLGLNLPRPEPLVRDSLGRSTVRTLEAELSRAYQHNDKQVGIPVCHRCGKPEYAASHVRRRRVNAAFPDVTKADESVQAFWARWAVAHRN